MDYTKMKAPQLILEIAKLEEQNKNLSLQATNAINIANWFAAVIEANEQLLIGAPFLNKQGKFFKSLFWVLSNFGTIKALIEEIYAKIQEWRKKVEELKQQQAAQVPNDTV